MDDSELIIKAQAIAHLLTYNEEPQGAAKHIIQELCHRLGSRVVNISKRKNGYSMMTLFGSERYLTWWETVMYRLFNQPPRGMRLNGAGQVPKPGPWPAPPATKEQDASV